MPGTVGSSGAIHGWPGQIRASTPSPLRQPLAGLHGRIGGAIGAARAASARAVRMTGPINPPELALSNRPVLEHPSLQRKESRDVHTARIP